MHRPKLLRTNTSPPSTKPHPPSHRRDLSSSSTTNTAHAKKATTVRPPRPAIHHRKSASAHYLPAHSSVRPPPPQSIGKLLGPGTGPASWSGQDDDEKHEMATSFLQYCAMCEKQITVPDNAVLYCSESCRRKDSCKPLSASSYTYTMSPSTTPPSSPPMSPRSIVAAMTPTGTSPRPIPGHLRIPSDLHDAKSDLDPTEWKPLISTRRNGSSASLASSEAWNYLSQFHPPAAADESASSMLMLPTRRTGYVHRSSASLSALAGYGYGAMIPTPSLSNTPTTAASSLNSNSDYIGYMYDPPAFGGGAVSTSSSTVTRPLPPRHNPSFSTAACATKGVELVVPHIVQAPPTAASAAAAATSPAESLGAEGGIWLQTRGTRHAASKMAVTPVVHVVDVGSKAH